MEEKQIYGYVYLVKNLVNGKMYFGITINDFDTRYKHGDISNTHNEHLKNSIEKYGVENFEINKEFDVAYTEDDLYDLEDMYMCIYNTIDSRYGYNKQRSGHKCKGHGKQSEETKCKISEALKDKPLSEETKQKMSESQKGKTKSEEHKRKISEALKGRRTKPHTEESRQKISEAFKGEKHPRARKVICLETKEIFDTIDKARKWCNIKSGISKCCKDNTKTAGKHPITKEPLHWQYYEDYLKLQEEQQNSDNLDTNNKIA